VQAEISDLPAGVRAVLSANVGVAASSATAIRTATNRGRRPIFCVEKFRM
jgi:hypothetical protein